MRLAIIGTGYVGLVSGACFSEFGHDVTCVDIIAVGTPSRRGDGHADLSYVFAAAEQAAQALTRPCVFVTKSTVPVGTAKQVSAIIAKARPDLAIEVASNPEFLREGSAIEDFMRPDRVVCGTASEAAQAVLRDIYRPLSLREVPILFVDCETSELIKYAANAFLAVKITFINEIADLCEKTGANVQQVARGIGMDNRIGSKFLHAGPGYGGSCFPKDTTALLKTAEDFESPMQIVKATVDVNSQRKRSMGRRVIQAAGGSVQDKKIALLGLTFKPNTDDMRDSPSIDIVRVLQDNGARVSAFDPEGRRQAEAMLDNVDFADDAYAAMDGADALVLVTEWNEFRALDLDRVKRLLNAPVIVDLLASSGLSASSLKPARSKSAFTTAGSMRCSLSTIARVSPAAPTWSMMPTTPPGFTAANNAVRKACGSVRGMRYSADSQ
ncbi:UDP-glucose/GDP-mannose dehydrogenase family protein [Rhizorhabdus sp.]|uniref:UDP-glucose dehydrogenase family protein n=1 Tax=Rhizorhabdus sp. TaxID=1968843 RepID=UPI0025F84C27|nr:UDP-glucose/GDP-mannose dehydrogenase family protein [Rhizorhabdus sp.]